MNSVTARGPTASQKRRNEPRSSGIVTANRASRFSPNSARSATKRSRSKFMLAPQVMDTRVRPLSLWRSTYCLMAATPSAPAGSRMLRVSWKTSLMAAHTSSVSTTTKSSTRARVMRRVSWPTRLTAVPSENRPTSASCTRRPARTERSMASESTVCTPMTFTSGRTALM